MAGGHNAKSPEAVSKDVAAAREKRASEVAEAKQDAAKDEDEAAAKVDDPEVVQQGDEVPDSL